MSEKTKKEPVKRTPSSKKKLEELKRQISELEIQLSETESRCADAEDASLRARAESENFKRRMQQDKDTAVKFAKESFIKELLPVLDSFDRALSDSNLSAQKVEDVIAGFDLIKQQFLQFFEKSQVTPIDALGEPFDPNMHQAISQRDAESDEKADHVVQVVQAGYRYHDRVVRPAMVVVSK